MDKANGVKGMKVLINDGMAQEGLDIFLNEGMITDTGKRDLIANPYELAGFDALLVRSATKVPKELLEEAKKLIASKDYKLKIIGRAGVGVDNIDLDACSENNIIVKNAPNGNTNSTAEHAVAQMFAAARKIPQAHNSLKNCTWNKKEYMGHTLAEKTTGIIGCGRIGQALAEKLLGLDMKVIGYDEHPEYVSKNFPNSRIRYVSKDELLRNSDFVSIHTGGKKVVIGAPELTLMKKTAYLIHVSRGGNVDENALYSKLLENKIEGAALDVFIGEKDIVGCEIPDSIKKLATLDNIVLTPHLGASTYSAQSLTSIEVASVVVGYLKYNDWTNAVNVTEEVDEDIRTWRIQLTNLDEPGIFGNISRILGEEGINIRKIPSKPFKHSNPEIKTASTGYLVHKKPSDEVLYKISQVPGVLNVTL